MSHTSIMQGIVNDWNAKARRGGLIPAICPRLRSEVEGGDYAASNHGTTMSTEFADCERSIILAADDVSRLRKPDVMRVCEDYFFAHGSLGPMIDYIRVKRPDLVSEAEQCNVEILKDYDQSHQ